MFIGNNTIPRLAKLGGEQIHGTSSGSHPKRRLKGDSPNKKERYTSTKEVCAHMLCRVCVCGFLFQCVCVCFGRYISFHQLPTLPAKNTNAQQPPKHQKQPILRLKLGDNAMSCRTVEPGPMKPCVLYVC